MSGSGAKQRREGVLCEAHADLGDVRPSLANARNATASEQSAPGVLRGYHKTVRLETDVSIWKPSGTSTVKSHE
jgi:hypothetical protein